MSNNAFSLNVRDIYGRKITISRRAIDVITRYFKKGQSLDVEVTLKSADVQGIRYYSN